MSRDFRSPTASFPIHLLLIIHLDKGSLVPPCAHMAGPRSPGLSHYLHKVVGYLVPRPRFSFLVPDPRSSFLVPRSRSSFLVPIPDVTYRFITPSPPSEKEASLTPGIIYTIILLTFVRAIPVLKTRNSLKKYIQKWGVAQKKPQKITTMRREPSVVCLVRASLLSGVLFLFMVNP